MAITQNDVARKANVSRATVSRVLNNASDPFISQGTRERVLEVVRELRYRPNYVARALATGRTNVIALWMPQMTSAFGGQIIHHVQMEARQRGFEMITSEFGNQTGWLSGEMDCCGWPVDGILAHNGGDWLKAAIEANVGNSIPVVSMGSTPAAIGDVVEIELGAAAREAINHLFDGGCKRVAHMLASQTWTSPREKRRDTYKAVMEEVGRRPEFIECQDSTRASGRQAVCEHVDKHGCPDGIFCANDDLAIGAYRGLRDLGIRIPDDCALVGCDGIEDAKYMDIPISTIVQPIEEACRLAWQFLHQRIRDPSSEMQKVTLDAFLLVRESSRRHGQ